MRQVFSVSGGSILAGFLAANWSSFADPKRFPLAAEEVIRYAQSDVRGRLIRRSFAFSLAWCSLLIGVVSLLLFGSGGAVSVGVGLFFLLMAGLALWLRHRFSLIAQFQADLGRRLRQIDRPRRGQTELKLLDLPDGNGDAPRFHILATDLTTGDPWAFTKEGVATQLGGDAFLAHDLYPLKSAVAASAAFPPMFSPVHFRRSADNNTLQIDHYLADGGVYDNLGIAAALDGLVNGRAKRIFVSNAERRFENIARGRFAFLIPRAARSTDILMNRVSTLHGDEISGGEHIRLANESPALAAKLPITAQRLIRNIRTDLNCFSPAECQLLVFKGYMEAWLALDSDPPQLEAFHYTSDGLPVHPKEDDRWLPFGEEELAPIKDISKELKESHETEAQLLSRRDLTGALWLLAAALLFVALNPISWLAAPTVWGKLPAWPSAPAGQWRLDETQPLPEGLETLKPYLWARIRPQNPDEVLTTGIFISEPLRQAYGFWPHGEITCTFALEEPLRPVRASAYLIDPDGRMRYLRINLEQREISMTVPAGSGKSRLCLALAALDDEMDGGVRPDGSSDLPKLSGEVVRIQSTTKTSQEE